MRRESSVRIAVAGATGFIGRALIKVLEKNHKVVALSRSHKSQSDKEKPIEWRSCDLFSLLDAEKALADVDVAIYLVHSMRPSAHLSQGSFADFDLIVADNFVRAAKKNKVQQIIFLGGMCPEGSQKTSQHLNSRKEVEDIFVDSGLPYTILRAAMIIGANGSSFHVMTRLVERLPVMLCPSWSQTLSQPVAQKDVVASLVHCAGNPMTFSKVFDLGGEDILSYRKMMIKIAQHLKLKRALIPVPLMSPGFSRLWVSVVTGAPRALVNPLIEGLKVTLVARPEYRLQIPDYKFLNFSESLMEAFKDYEGDKKPHAFKKTALSYHEARSVQRLPLPPNWNAEDVAKAYMKFLPRLHTGFIFVEVNDPWVKFIIRFTKIPILVLQYSRERSWDHRQLFYVRGGLLSKKIGKGRLEFREILGGKACIAAIHDFRPRLPWPVYVSTQAIFHLWVMKQFGRSLAKAAKREKK